MADVPVGRDRELAVLRDRLTAAEHRPGAVVLVGVAGIGKSWPAAQLAHLDTCQPSTNRHITSAYSAGLGTLRVSAHLTQCDQPRKLQARASPPI